MQITFVQEGTHEEQAQKISRAYLRLVKQFMDEYLKEEIKDEGRAVYSSIDRRTSKERLLHTGTN